RHNTRPRTNLCGKQFEFLDTAILECSGRHSVNDWKLGRFVVHQFGFEILDSFAPTLMFIPERPDSRSRVEGSGGYRLADRRQRAIGLLRIPENACAADEFHPRLFLRSFRSGNENRAD